MLVGRGDKREYLLGLFSIFDAQLCVYNVQLQGCRDGYARI